MEVSPITLVLIALFSGLGNAAGQWFFKEYLEPHAKKVVDNAAKIKDIKVELK